MFKLPAVFLRPSVTKKLIHLSGLTLLYPILTLNRWQSLVLFGSLGVLSWVLFRFPTYGLIGVCLFLILADRKVAAMAWVTLIMGDGASGLCGLSWGGKPLPWNKNKTVIGSLAFMTSALASLILFVGAEFNLPLVNRFIVAVLVSLGAALVESLPFKINDNLTVVITGGAISWLCLVKQI